MAPSASPVNPSPTSARKVRRRTRPHGGPVLAWWCRPVMVASPGGRISSVNRYEIVVAEQGVDQVPARPGPGIGVGGLAGRARGAFEQERLPREERLGQLALTRARWARQDLLE